MGELLESDGWEMVCGDVPLEVSETTGANNEHDWLIVVDDI